MATSKPDIMIILLSKLMEEGDMFYKVRDGREGQRFLKTATDCFLHLASTDFLIVRIHGSRGQGKRHPSPTG